MKIFAAILVCGYFLFSFPAFPQPAESPGQYPFVTYTTKDGLISNRVRKIYQDSSGRLFFLTYNGLSIYDAERFTNYSTEDGLGNGIINDVMQMGKDSFWIAANTEVMNCLVHGKIKTLVTIDGYYPVVNQLSRNKGGKLFVTADEGLFIYEDNRFKHLSFINQKGDNAGFLLRHIQIVNDKLMLVQSDASAANKTPTLFLYDYTREKLISGFGDIDFCAAPGNNYWIMTQHGLRMLDTNALAQNKLELKPLPQVYKRIASWITNSVFFDKDENCWLASPGGFLAKCDPHGDVIFIASQKTVSEQEPGEIFQDKEGILWFNFSQAGISKLVNTDISMPDEVFGMHHISDINYCRGIWIVYDDKSKKIIFSDSSTQLFSVGGNTQLLNVTATAKGIYAFSADRLYKLLPKPDHVLQPVEIRIDSEYKQTYRTALEDDNGNFMVAGDKFLCAVIDGSTTVSVPINALADQLAKDRSGNIWVANRSNQVIEFSVHPGTPEKYLQPERQYDEEFKNINIRSACFDSSGNLWIGTRAQGLYRASFKDNKTSLVHFTKKDGLSDNFNTYLACDDENNLWACSPSGLDKISFRENKFTVVNISRQSNLFGRVDKVVFWHDTAWALTEAGTIMKIAREGKTSLKYTPRLFLAFIKKGRDTILPASSYKFQYFDNDLLFYFAAPSFFQEAQIQYTFRLNGGDTAWSEPSPNAFISFVNLAPGNYILQAKVSFPAGRYADQMIEIPVIILPPWWQTRWFTFLILIFIIVLSIAGMKIYVNRRLARQRIIMEKQQAIEKERTRIATDMHDDLGAGLSRIKFLSEIVKLKTQSQQTAEDDISRIGEYAREMIGKMGEIVWALDKKNDSLGGLVAYTRVYAVEYLTQNGIAANVQTPDSFPDVFVTGEIRRNIFLTVKEALHNVVKHAKADRVNINICIERNIAITVSDNGIGIDKNNMRPFSNGIANMQKRITEIGGTLEIKNNNGTNVYIKVPIDL